MLLRQLEAQAADSRNAIAEVDRKLALLEAEAYTKLFGKEKPKNQKEAELKLLLEISTYDAYVEFNKTRQELKKILDESLQYHGQLRRQFRLLEDQHRLSGVRVYEDIR